MTSSPVGRRPLWFRLGPIGLIAALLVTIWLSGTYRYLSLDTLRAQQEVLRTFVSGHLVVAVAIYLAVYVIATVAMVPGALWITITGGFLFGLAGGTALTVAGATLGASVLFFAAKSSVGAALRERAGPFLKRLESGFQADALSYMFALRLLPAVPFPIANIAPALLGARYRDYALTTAIGIVPGVLAYTWIGAGLGATFAAGEDPDLAGVARNLAPALAALGLVALIPIAWKKLRPGRTSPHA